VRGKGGERIVGKAAGDVCVFIPGRAELADEVSSTPGRTRRGGEGVTRSLNRKGSYSSKGFEIAICLPRLGQLVHVITML